MNDVNRRVNLFVLGAAKCGTTTLHHYLDQHPSILMAHPKEPLFFEAEYELGHDYYLEKYFSGLEGQSILGESRHRNLYLPFVVPRIKAYASDDAKFLVILRNPVDRAYSHWWHNYSWGDEKRGFKEAVEVNLRRLESGPFFESEEEAILYRETLNFRTGFSPYVSYIDSGFYADQIQRYNEAFGPGKIKILLLDDLKADTKGVMESVFKFIGVDHRVSIDFAVRNEANSVIGKKALKSLKYIPGKNLVPHRLRSKIYHQIRCYFRSTKKPSLSTDNLQNTLMEIYEPHICKLEQLTERDLGNWRRSGI